MRDIPHHGLHPYTVIHNTKTNSILMRVEGIFVLPVGSEVELIEPNVNAVVTHVRLLAAAAGSPATVCLDVDVPQEWIDAN